MVRERSKMSVTKNVHQRIAAVMQEVQYVQKTGFNGFHKYKYAKEADYINALRPALLKHGLLILPHSQKTTFTGELTTVEMEFKIVNVDDPTDSVIIPAVGQGADKGDKGAYKAQTGAKKYMISLGFLIETGDDAEADENDVSSPKKTATKPSPDKEAKQEPARTAPAPETKAAEAPKKEPTPEKEYKRTWTANNNGVKTATTNKTTANGSTSGGW